MYKCICGFNTKSSNELKQHMDKCSVILEIKENAPLCYCGIRLKPYIRKGEFLSYQKHCGDKECSKKHMSVKHSGRKWSEEHKINHNKTKYKENIIRYGNFECEICGKKFISNTSLRAHVASCGKHVDDIFECEICGKFFKSNSGLKTHYRYKHDTSKHAKYIKKKQIEIGRKIQEKNRKKQRHVSGLESYFEKFLKEMKIEYIRQFRLKNNGILYFYDFYIPSKNTVIEVDGDYWHCNPSKFILENLPKYIQDYKTIEKTKEAYLLENGYNIIRFWEDDIVNNEDNVKKRLNDEFRND